MDVEVRVEVGGLRLSQSSTLPKNKVSTNLRGPQGLGKEFPTSAPERIQTLDLKRAYNQDQPLTIEPTSRCIMRDKNCAKRTDIELPFLGWHPSGMSLPLIFKQVEYKILKNAGKA